MTVIYIDLVFAVNFIVNYLLIATSAKLTGETMRRLRFLVSALFGSGYASFAVLPDYAVLSHPAIKASVAVLMILLAFGKSRHLLRLSLIFFAVSCGFAGAILAVGYILGGGLTTGTVLFPAISMRDVVMAALLGYGILTLLFQRGAAHSRMEGELIPVDFQLGKKSVRLTALRDSGNTLFDPITGQPVLIAEADRMWELLSDLIDIREINLSDPVDTFRRIGQSQDAIRFRLLPFRAVGTDHGFLLAFRADSVKTGKEIFKDQLVALSPTHLSDGGSYGALIGDQKSGRRESFEFKGKGGLES